MNIKIGPVHLDKLNILKSEVINCDIHAHIEAQVEDNSYKLSGGGGGGGGLTTSYGVWKGILTLTEHEVHILHNSIHREKC